MARTMFTEKKDTKIYRVVVEAVVTDGTQDWWSQIYGPYPKKGTRDAQLTRVRKDLDGVIRRQSGHGLGGLVSYEAYPEEGEISWAREDA